jgi:hypothetical protein
MIAVLDDMEEDLYHQFDRDVIFVRIPFTFYYDLTRTKEKRKETSGWVASVYAVERCKLV